MGLHKRWWITPCVIFTIGLALLLCAIIVPFRIEKSVDDTLIDEFLFNTDSGKAYERWSSNENPDSASAWAEIYLFNTTNADDVICCNAKPIIKQIGPFYYQQYLRNINATFSTLDTGERVVTSTPYIYSIFNRSRSVDDESVLITMPGVGWWGLAQAYAARNDPDSWGLVKMVLNIMYYPYLTMSVHDWLFGYTDPVLAFVKNAAPGLVEDDFVALFRNSSSPEEAFEDYGTSTVSCGYPNAGRFQEMINYQGEPIVDYWNPPSKVEGSPGNYFGFRLKGQEKILIHFWNAISRTLLLNHTATGTWKDIKYYRYAVDPKEYYNATLNPKNEQYWQLKFNGALNLTSQKQAPIFFTRGHFLGMDPEYQNAVEGLNAPDPATDDIFMDIQPLTGACIVARKPFQVNLMVGNFVDTAPAVNISNLFLHPLTYIVLGNELSDAQADELRDALEFYDRAVVASAVVLYGGVLFGAALVIIAAYITYVRREEQKAFDAQVFYGEDSDGQVPAQVDISYGAVEEGF